ncbi:hypothetical protein HMPREF0973_00634 [Prevotella veroralis F0319]|uniref:Uncharacterized protein n=1 Tax=Prevotella veroralis F0319 TaxID=649761 RepID=C9MM08_9BACT|nr:hypothetical protein HMPREF0973_00634 [Prevotella veroralis F0319]
MVFFSDMILSSFLCLVCCHLYHFQYYAIHQSLMIDVGMIEVKANFRLKRKGGIPFKRFIE